MDFADDQSIQRVIFSVNPTLNLSDSCVPFQLTEAGRESPTVLLAIAQFDLYPLRFVGLAEITKKVTNRELGTCETFSNFRVRCASWR